VSVHAAGGIVVRDGLVLVVHRPNLDDWSFPKGKLEAIDADLAACALREVWEETGFGCTVGPDSTMVRYALSGGRTKEVTYWLMSVTSGHFVANAEVDAARWLHPVEAATLLTYDSDRVVLGQLLR
jgi:8-oxo-dGTP pyrophosphatase MutT (NUDIX family)